MKKLISTYIKAAAALLVTALLGYSCSKGESDYTLTFTSPALFFNYGQTQSVTYSASNVGSFSISSTPAGWEAKLDESTRTVTITAPDTLDESEDEDGNSVKPVANGTLVLRGYSGETLVSTSLYISIGDVVDMAGKYANSYILSKPQTAYRISAARPDGSAVENIASVEVLWSSKRYLIRYPEDKNGNITFVTYYNDDNELLEGNALLAAYDEDENILWSWHLWVTGFDPEENAVALNGHTFMGCNLGAFGNSTESNKEILASYGLYYQWGRPSPFPRPLYFDCAGSTTEPLYTATVSTATMTVEENDGENSTMNAAIANPLVFITGMETPWGGTNQPWSDTSKSNYDPCPAGWRVPASNVFAGLTIVSDELASELESLRKAYGWTLTDGSRQAFFFAGGRRSYLNGSVINMNTQDLPQPWEGFYWTSSLETSRTNATGMFFDLNTVDASASRLTTARQLQLSNGLQIRCVKE